MTGTTLGNLVRFFFAHVRPQLIWKDKDVIQVASRKNLRKIVSYDHVTRFALINPQSLQFSCLLLDTKSNLHTIPTLHLHLVSLKKPLFLVSILYASKSLHKPKNQIRALRPTPTAAQGRFFLHQGKECIPTLCAYPPIAQA